MKEETIHLETQINVLQNGKGARAEETTKFKMLLLMSVNKPSSQRRILGKHNEEEAVAVTTINEPENKNGRLPPTYFPALKHPQDCLRVSK